MIEGHTQYFAFDSGLEDKEPLLLIHGFPFDHRLWKNQIEQISFQYRLIAPDLQGFGKTTRPGLVVIDHMADDLAAFLGQISATPAHVVGFSMGGYVALRMIERHPEVVRSLILVNTRAEEDADQTKVKRFEKIRDIQGTKDLGDFADSFLKTVFAPSSLIQDPDILLQAKKIILEQKDTSITQALMAMAARPDSVAALAHIRVPTLIIAGEQDELIPLSSQELMHKAIPGSRLEVIPEAGHMIPLEKPVELQNLINEFIAGLPRSAEQTQDDLQIPPQSKRGFSLPPEARPE